MLVKNQFYLLILIYTFIKTLDVYKNTYPLFNVYTLKKVLLKRSSWVIY